MSLDITCGGVFCFLHYFNRGSCLSFRRFFKEMSWIVLHFIGIISYAASGAFVALEAKYSFIGVYALGLTTAFGGALIRNIIIGVPVTELWDPVIIFTVLMTLTIIVFLPLKLLNHWRRWSLFLIPLDLLLSHYKGRCWPKRCL